MLTTAAARAADATPTPAEAYLSGLQTANKIASERYGAAATPKAGDVTGASSLAAMALLLEPRAYDAVAADVSKRVREGTGRIFVTSKADVAGLIASAELVRDKIESMINEGETLAHPQPPGQIKFAGAMLTVPAVMAMAGAVDSLVGLFRSDYSVSSAELDGNLLGLQLAIQRRMGGRVRIDGLALYAASSALEARLSKLDEVRATLAARKPAEKTPEASFVDAADKVLAALRTLSDAGVAPAARIGLLLDQTRDLDAVLYVDVIKPTGSAVTTKRLFSLNRKVHLHLTGLVNTVYQYRDGALDGKTYRLGESATLDLRDLERTSYAKLDIATE